MITVDYNGIPVELSLRVGFTVHNQDGTSYIPVFVTAEVPPGPPDGDGGEPLPIEGVA